MKGKFVKKLKEVMAITMAITVIFFIFMSQKLLYSESKTSAATFLKIPVSARAVSLGENTVVLGNDIGNISENPSLLGFIKQYEFQTSYGSYVEGYNFFNISYGLKNDLANLGISITRLSASDFEGRDIEGAPTGNFSANDMAFNISAAKSFKNFSLGINIKYISSKIENESASAIAMDAGFIFWEDKSIRYPYRIGFSIRNLGTRIKYINESEELPLIACVGLGMTIDNSMDIGISISNNLTENTFEFGVGATFDITKNLSLIGGFRREISNQSDSSVPLFFNAGIGFKISNFNLDYAFVPLGDIGNTHRISVTLKFGNDKEVSGFTNNDNSKKFNSRKENNKKEKLDIIIF
jgi:hypothetical protein